MIALIITGIICASALLLAWWARGVVLTSIAEGTASEEAAKLAAETALLRAEQAKLASEAQQALDASGKHVVTLEKRIARLEETALFAKRPRA